MALSAARLTQAASCCSSGRVLAASVRPLPRRPRGVALRAAADNSSVQASTSPPPVLNWPQDTETARDVFAFAGSLPERLNGRMAMLFWLAEVTRHAKVPATEQFAGDVGGVLLLSLALLLGSVFPKFVSGSSLKDLHASATSDNLRGQGGAGGQFLSLFDSGLELWVGRVAMLGVAGLIVLETVTGRPLL